MAGAEAQQPFPGARVLLGGKHRATVRYVGTIDGQQGTWVGIEYDEAGKGKHDGSHGGRRYFSCAHDPTAGSFVRLAKFLEAADFGRSLLAAAQERYGLGGATGAAGQLAGASAASEPQEELYVSTTSNRRVAVELVLSEAASAAGRHLSGAGGAAALAAVLVQQSISSLGVPLELRGMLPSLTELDLSENLISSWSFVAELATALPSLRALNLSGNRLALPSLADAAPLPSLAGLQTLVLNGCGVGWEQAVAVARQLPGLRELHLCGNRLASLQLPAAALAAAGAGLEGLSLSPDDPAKSSSSVGGSDGVGSSCGSNGNGSTAALLAAAFPQLELLDLEDNALASWHADVARLCELPRLRSLLLSGNQMADVQYRGGFTSLRALLLGGNQLASWQAASQLDAFPALEEARLSDNPLTAAAPGAARYQCIARISRLTTLNASTVSAAERWDAEVNYLRLVTDELAVAGADGAAAVADAAAAAAAPAAARAAVLAAHPRVAALTQKYGELTPAAPKAASGSALASSMAAVTICHGAKRLEKKLPVSLTVGKLKLMLERLLRVKAGQQALLLVPPPEASSSSGGGSSGGVQPEDITDDDARELRYYDVCDGCRLEVSAADPAARAAALAAAKAGAAAAHAQRMEQQERSIQQFRAVEQRLMA